MLGQLYSLCMVLCNYLQVVLCNYTVVQVYILYCAVVLSNSKPLEEMTHSYGFGVVFIGVGGVVTTCCVTSLM